MVFALRRYWSGTKKRQRMHMTPAEREKVDGKRKPPFWTRIALILSAIGVSFSHGANDGQKGIGLDHAGADRRCAGRLRGQYECNRL
jgi:low-affinity inorganic phosphate transporter